MVGSNRPAFRGNAIAGRHGPRGRMITSKKSKILRLFFANQKWAGNMNTNLLAKILLRVGLSFAVFMFPAISSAQSLTFDRIILQFDYNGATVTPALLVYENLSTTTAACTPTGSIFPSYPREIFNDTNGATTTRLVTYDFSPACTVSLTSYAKFTDDTIWVLPNGGVNTPAGDRYYISLDDGSVFQNSSSVVSHYFALTGNIAYSSSFYEQVQYAFANASSTIPQCGFTHIGACIAQGFAWAFIADPDALAAVQSLSLASTSPFGYGYELSSIISNLSSSSSVPYSYTLDLTSVQTQLQTIVPSQTLGTTSVELFNVCWVNTKTGNAYATYILPFLMAAYTLLALGALYLLAHSFF